MSKIWSGQKKLTKAFGGWTSNNQYERTLQLTRPLMHEVLEVERELEKYWKGWKKSSKDSNHTKIKQEIIDCWHFLTQISQEYFSSEKELEDWYMDKNKENFKRIERGY